MRNKLLTALFVLLFIGLAADALIKKPEVLNNIYLSYSALFIPLLSLLIAALNGKKIQVMFRANNKSISFKKSLHITATSTLGSFIPIIGTAGIKFLYLTANKISKTESIKILTKSSLTYILSLSFIFFIGINIQDKNLSIVTTLAGIFFLVLTGRSLSKKKHNTYVDFFSCDFLIIFFDSLRLFIIFEMLNTNINFNEILILQGSNISSLSGSIVPGAIGLKESLALILSKLTTVSPEMTVLAFSANRITGYACLAIILLTIQPRSKKQALVIADIDNSNLGDKLIFNCLSKELIDQGHTQIIKLTNHNKHTGKIVFINYKNILRVYLYCLKSQTIIIGGGGIIQDRTSQANLWFYVLFSLLALLSGKKVIIKSVGATNTNKSLSILAIKILLFTAKSISARDKSSIQTLKKYTNKHICLEKDLAYNFIPPYYEHHPAEAFINREPYILVSLRPTLNDQKNFSIDENQLTNALHDAISQTLIEKIVLAPFQQQDKKILLKLSNKLSNKKTFFVDALSAEDYYQLSKNASLIIAMRYHAALLGLLVNNNCIGIAYDEKVTSLFTSLNKYEQCLNLKDIDQLSEKIKKIIPNLYKARQ